MKGLDEYTKVLLHFNSEDNSIIDECSNQWTLYGTPIINSNNAKFNSKSLHLDGMSYIELSDFELGGKDFTIDYWCYTNSSTSQLQSMSFSLYPDATSNDSERLFCCMNSNNCYSFYYDTFSEVVIADSSYKDTLVHIAIVYINSTKTVRTYLNGQLKGTITYTKEITRQKRYLCIGGCTGNRWLFGGDIDEFRISDGIARWKEGSFILSEYPYDIGLDTYTKILLHFDDEDNLLKDECNNDWYINGNPIITDSKGKFTTKSLYLDGSSCIYTDNKEELRMLDRDWTIDWWSYATDIKSFQCIFGSGIKGENNNKNAFVIGTMYSKDTVGLMEFLCGNNDSAWNVLYEHRPYGDRDLYIWTHWAIVRKDDTIYIFKNGTKVATANIGTESIGYYETQSLSIGGWFYENQKSYCRGLYINEFRYSVGIARWTDDFYPPERKYFSKVIDSNLHENSIKSLMHFDNANNPLKDEIVDNKWNLLDYNVEILLVFDGYNMRDIANKYVWKHYCEREITLLSDSHDENKIEFISFESPSSSYSSTATYDSYTKSYLRFETSATADEVPGNTWVANGTSNISTTNAKLGKALQLTGSNYLTKTGGITLGGQDFTIDCWACSTNNTSG